MMKPLLRSLPTDFLILLFVYAAVSKLMTFSIFRIQLNRQTFAPWLAELLLYFLPAAELGTVVLLFINRTRLMGLSFSLTLLIPFTIYIFLVLLHYWNRVPCSCGGILNGMSWGVHLAFNILCVTINLIAIFIHFRERRDLA